MSTGKSVRFNPVKSFLNLFSFRSIKTALQTVFNLDYGLTQSIMPVFGIVGSIAYVVFHYTKDAAGYSHSVSLRNLVVAISLSVLFWPRDG